MDENSTLWEIIHSSWILLSLIIFLNWSAMLWAGIRVKENKWIIEGGIYFLITVLFIAVANIAPDSSMGGLFAIIFLLIWIVSIVRPVIIRKEFIKKLRLKSTNQTPTFNYQYNMPNNSYNQQNNQYDFNQNTNTYSKDNDITFNQTQDNQIEFNQPNNDYQETDNKITFNNDANNNSIEFNQKNNTDVNDNSNNLDFDENNKNELDVEVNPIDINKASAEDIAQLPGINLILAKKIIQERNNGVYVNSIDDLQEKLNLTPKQVEQIKDYVIITSVQQTSRRIDL